MDILASGEHKCSYLAQTRSKTKRRRQNKIRSYITPPNESSESQDSSAAPQSDTDNAKWESPSAVCLLSTEETEKITDNTGPEFPPWKMENSGDIQPYMGVKLSRARKADIKEAVKTYKAARGTAAARTDRATMQVDTGKALPSGSPLYRLPHARRPIVQKEIKEMLREGIIQPSHGPWAAPIILVPKKDGSLRICVDYRKLNVVTTPDPFPIPRVEDLLDGMSSAKFITILDLARGYWQVPMEPASRVKTAFSTDFGKYEFMVMPFGLVGVPATFQRPMNELFGDLHGKVAVYMDDLAIYSETWEDHPITTTRGTEETSRGWSANQDGEMPVWHDVL